ncbi:hypothetical protein ONS96_000423 [Cadophora gregata f. sp. sojae]|nr:hypothetical protein ONS96_000423 [Cadophora gregata f. sp. sojae]
MLGELRSMLPKNTVWFGCTATLPLDTLHQTLHVAGFKKVTTEPSPHTTTIIRTSIDRQDVSLAVVPIPRKKLTVFDRLYYLLDQAIEVDTQEITPEKIPKTIIFIDSIKQCEQLARWLQHHLVLKTATWSGRRYTNNALDSVIKIVQTFHSRVSRSDRDLRYNAFRVLGSTCRLMIATTSMGTGMNIPDIGRVVMWKLPIDPTPNELWQRAGRGGRGEGQTCEVHVFVPYWVMDNEGKYPEPKATGSNAAPSPKVSSQKPVHRNLRHLLPGNRIAIRTQSRLRETTSISEVPDDIYPSDVESVDSNKSATSDTDEAEPTNTMDNGKRLKVWTQSEMRSRDNLPTVYKEVCNAACQRNVLLKLLGEHLLPIEKRNRPLKRNCCTGCNPDLTPPSTELPPGSYVGPDVPRKSSRGAFALQTLKEWCTECALLFDSSFPNSRFHLGPEMFMPSFTVLTLAAAYADQKSNYEKLGQLTWDELIVKVPQLDEWEYKESWRVSLLNRLSTLHEVVEEEVQKERILRAAKKRASKEYTAESNRTSDSLTPTPDVTQSSQGPALAALNNEVPPPSPHAPRTPSRHQLMSPIPLRPSPSAKDTNTTPIPSPGGINWSPRAYRSRYSTPLPERPSVSLMDSPIIRQAVERQIQASPSERHIQEMPENKHPANAEGGLKRTSEQLSPLHRHDKRR